MLRKISTLLFLLFVFMLQPIIPGSIVHAATVQEIVFGTTVSGYITETSDKDTYKMVLPKAGRVKLSMELKVKGVHVQLKDTSDNLALSRYLSDGNEYTPKVWSESVDLEPGTYYLNVEQYSSYIGAYNLKVDFTQVNNNDVEPNDGTITAQQLTLNANAVIGYISWNDKQDTYKIVLPKAGKVDLNVISKIEKVHVNLKDVNGNRALDYYLSDGSEENPQQWSESVDLEPGTYYLNVENYGSYTGTYSVKVNFTEANNNDVEPNSGNLTSQQLTLNANAVIGYISWNDKKDTYKIVLPKAGKVDLNVISKIKKVYVNLKDTNGNNALNDYPSDGSEENPQQWSGSVDLEAGTYYLNIEQYGSYTGRYSVEVDFTQANSNDVESNNGTMTAQQLALNSNAVIGYIPWNDKQDIYIIILPKAGKVDLNVISKIKEIHVELKDAHGNQVLSDYPYDGSEENPKIWSRSENLEAGTYYLNIEKYGSYTGRYSVKVNFTDANNNDIEPNNGTSTAQKLTLNSNPITGYISWSDKQDSYKIELPKDGKLNLNMVSRIEGVQVELEDTNNKSLKYQYIYDGSEESPKTWSDSIDLKAGTYYLNVLKYSSYTGKYTIRATASGQPTLASLVKLNTSALNLIVGNSGKLTATVSPTNATNKAVTWSTSNSKVAIVDANGKITATGAGTATITCTTKDGSKKSATCKVTVTNPVKVLSIKLNKTNLNIVKGDTAALTATLSPNNATNKGVTWVSSNTKVAIVDANGKITATGAGTATITCTTKDGSKKSATCKVTVTNPVKVTSVKLNKTSLSIIKGKTSTLTATVAPSTATNKAVTWVSSNTKIATVDSNGKITAKESGTVTITCTAKDGSKKSAVCKITVTK